jgi:hypothetical protein
MIARRPDEVVTLVWEKCIAETPISSFICSLFRGDMSSFLRNGAFHQQHQKSKDNGQYSEN